MRSSTDFTRKEQLILAGVGAGVLLLILAVTGVIGGGAECLPVDDAVIEATGMQASDAAAVEGTPPDEAPPIFQSTLPDTDLWFVALETPDGPALFSVVRDPSSSSWIGPIFAANAIGMDTDLGVDVPNRPTIGDSGSDDAIQCLDA